MLNNVIIKEFMKLILFINDEYEKALDVDNKPDANKHNFRIKQFKNVLSILKKHDKELTLENFNELKSVKGIGAGTLTRIEEILLVGSLSELKNYSPTKSVKKEIISDLESVIGIGHAIAVDLYDKGIKSVKDLKKKYKKGEIELNDKILLGLKYHGIIQVNIPRSEITSINSFLETQIEKMNKLNKTTKSTKFVYKICGSYRRQKSFSNDIDILVSKLNTDDTYDGTYLDELVTLLKKKSKDNNNKPFLIDDMTDNTKTKYMGFGKYLDNPVRRVDIRFINYSSYHSALLYFTGSKDLNTQMRQIAKKKGYKLSEYGLFQGKKKLEITSEKDIFDLLDLKYVEPKHR
jgi:DNA polymerase/3'-5' exonuclease PolX